MLPSSTSTSTTASCYCACNSRASLARVCCTHHSIFSSSDATLLLVGFPSACIRFFHSWLLVLGYGALQIMMQSPLLCVVLFLMDFAMVVHLRSSNSTGSSVVISIVAFNVVVGIYLKQLICCVKPQTVAALSWPRMPRINLDGSSVGQFQVVSGPYCSVMIFLLDVLRVVRPYFVVSWWFLPLSLPFFPVNLLGKKKKKTRTLVDPFYESNWMISQVGSEQPHKLDLSLANLGFCCSTT